MSLITPSLRARLDERVDDTALCPSGWVALVPAGPLTTETLNRLAVDLAERLSLPCHLPDHHDGLGGVDPEDVTLVFDDGASAELWLGRVPASSEAIQEAQTRCWDCDRERDHAAEVAMWRGETYPHAKVDPDLPAVACHRHRRDDYWDSEGHDDALEVGAAALGLRPLRMPALLAETKETAPVLALVHREAVERYEAWEATRWEVQA